MKQYYIHNGIEQKGPFDLEQLKSQNLKKETPVWHEGLANWTIAGDIEELKEVLSLNATPPPFIRLTEEPKTAPPQFEENIPKPAESTPLTYHEMYPENKKSKMPAFLVATFILLAGIASWAIWQNTETIGVIEEKVSAQEEYTNERESAADKAAEERERANRAATEKNRNFRNNWANYIHLNHTDPKIDYTFGGVSRFHVTVSNETSYSLDQVDITINYIRKNGNICQTETISIFNIPADGNGSVTAPSSANGVQVSCTISKIASNKMHFCYPFGSGDGEDPYYCR